MCYEVGHQKIKGEGSGGGNEMKIKPDSMVGWSR